MTRKRLRDRDAVVSAAREVTIGGYYKAQALLEKYIGLAQGQEECDRMRLAQQLSRDWLSHGFPTALLPIDMRRGDDWYFVQLLTMSRHVADDGTPIRQPFDLSTVRTVRMHTLSPSTGLCRDEAEEWIRTSDIPLRLVRFDELLLLREQGQFLERRPIHVFGWRRKSDASRSGLFATTDSDYDSLYIDSFWPEHALSGVRTITVEKGEE